MPVCLMPVAAPAHGPVRASLILQTHSDPKSNCCSDSSNEVEMQQLIPCDCCDTRAVSSSPAAGMGLGGSWEHKQPDSVQLMCIPPD